MSGRDLGEQLMETLASIRALLNAQDATLDIHSVAIDGLIKLCTTQAERMDILTMRIELLQRQRPEPADETSRRMH